MRSGEVKFAIKERCSQEGFLGLRGTLAISIVMERVPEAVRP